MTTMNTYADNRTATNGSDDRTPLREHAEAIREDVRNLREDTTAAACDAAHAISDTAKNSAQVVTDVTKTGAEKAGEYHDAVCRTVRKHPTASVVTAVAAGIFLGKLLGR